MLWQFLRCSSATSFTPMTCPTSCFSLLPLKTVIIFICPHLMYFLINSDALQNISKRVTAFNRLSVQLLERYIYMWSYKSLRLRLWDFIGTRGSVSRQGKSVGEGKKKQLFFILNWRPRSTVRVWSTDYSHNYCLQEWQRQKQVKKTTSAVSDAFRESPQQEKYHLIMTNRL